MNLKLFSFLIFFGAQTVCYGQHYYNLTVSNATYTELTGETQLTYISTSTDQGYYHSTNLIFPVFGKQADFNKRTTPVVSQGAFLSSAGYMAIYESPAYKNTILIQAFNNSDIITQPGTTKVSVKADGSGNDKILKFQWKDAIYKTTAQKVNLQIWLHEKDGTISFHYGPSTFTGAKPSASVGMLIIDSSFANLLNIYCLTAGSSAPVPKSGGSSWGDVVSLNDFPSNGTVYTLRPKTAGLLQEREPASFAVFPNPAAEYVSIKSGSAQTIMMFNSQGQKIKELSVSAGISQVSLSELPAGAYFLKNMKGEVLPVYHIK